jgi:hypothetical protein
MEDSMLNHSFLTRIAGAIGIVAIAMLVPPLTETATGIAVATDCLPPLHNDPWIGCVP